MSNQLATLRHVRRLRACLRSLSLEELEVALSNLQTVVQEHRTREREAALASIVERIRCSGLSVDEILTGLKALTSRSAE
ncbi:hypothetical protein VIC_001358 [Vibrio coralliilyticus ATCC BAA-450]|nr:hypothetical protein VIC_001358 [Vibrio coralliilyticus ATCC BAA-450]